MKGDWASVGLALTLAGAAAASEEVAMPVWPDGERAVAEKAGWVAGASLLTGEALPNLPGLPAQEPLAIAPPTDKDLAVAEPTVEVAEKFWEDYFEARPQSFLLDPQAVLSPVDARERLEFLKYHASDSGVDLFVYIFKGEQEIPGELRAEEVVERFFTTGLPAVVVYYFMGAPQRSVLHLSPALTDAVTGTEQRRALESAVMQALKVPDPARQFEGFLVQMSIRIYWMEQLLGGGGVVTEAPARPLVAKAPQASKTMEKLRPWLEMARAYVEPAVAVAAAMLLLLALIAWLKRRARFRFPDLGVEPRLGGAHAAGIGAVISFASATLPPASQRDQVPADLRRR